MEKVCVVTGGGSGMGFETARIIGKDHHIILAGRTVSKLENAIQQLKAEGISAEAYPGDVSNPASVKELALYAAGRGTVSKVIHAAGVSSHMASGENIFKINAMGTIYIDNEFAEIMGKDGCILNVSSMSAYMLPMYQLVGDSDPHQFYPLSFSNQEQFLAAANQMIGAIPEEIRPVVGYVISKNFVLWYTERMALRCGRKGIRVVSISPGTFTTPMGIIEGESAEQFGKSGALGRLGDPVEIAKMMAFMASPECSYLTGADILYDGGCIAALNAGEIKF